MIADIALILVGMLMGVTLTLVAVYWLLSEYGF